jgi:DNA-binding transcriptional regulator GbsR (MarR family)
MGDRRDHFESLKDIWDIFLIITEERKKREIDPTLSMLRSVVIEAESDPGLDKEVKKRIQDTLEFMEMTTAWYEQVSRMPRSVLIQLLKTGKRIESLLGKKRKA